MAMIKIGTSPKSRIEAGAAVLAAASTIDMRPVQVRFKRFQEAQRAYVEAQRKVGAAEAELAAAQGRVQARDGEQDEAVEALACALVAERAPRANPFAVFGAPAPKALMGLPITEEIKTVYGLVAAVQRINNTTKPVLQAAQALEKAARNVEQVLAPIAELRARLREARHMRDAVGQTWTSALAGLKRDTRSATDEGAPLLHTTLFDRPARPAKNHKTTPAPAPADQPPATNQTANGQ